MARFAFIARAIDEAGNAVGGSSYEVRVYDDLACSTPSVVTDDAGGGTTIAQPITPNSGAWSTLTTTTGASDTHVHVASVTGFAVGQYIPIFDGTNTVYRFIRSIDAGNKILNLNDTVGYVFSNTNTQVGALDCVGLVAGFVTDSSYHYLQVTDVASGRKMPPTYVPMLIANMSVAVQEEGTTVSTRPTLNFVGAGVTVTDDAGNLRTKIEIFSGATVNTYTGNDTWSKPSGAKTVMVIIIGAGGGAGGGRAGNVTDGNFGGGGGGGGERRVIVMDASALGATASITVGALGTGGNGGSTTQNGFAGAAGGDSSFGSFTAKGGSYGSGGTTNSGLAGAGGGSTGTPTSAPGHGQEAGPALYAAENGGAGGGGGGGGATQAMRGANALLGGGGGGGGGGYSTVPAATGGANGGVTNLWLNSTSASDNVTGAGANGTSRSGTGRAGDGGQGANAGTYRGGDGGVPGGGGGGGGGVNNQTNGGRGGDGARGEVIVITWV